MKKWLYSILSISLLLNLTGCKIQRDITPKDLIYDRPEGIVEIDYESLKEKLDSNTDFILYIGRPDCSDCKMFYPYLEAYIDSDLEDESIIKGIYYLDIKSFRDAASSEDATQEEIEFYANLKEELEFAWTPTLAHYQCGKVVDSYEFLDSSFGRMDESEEKQRELERFVRDFENWMTTNLKTN